MPVDESTTSAPSSPSNTAVSSETLRTAKSCANASGASASQPTTDKHQKPPRFIVVGDSRWAPRFGGSELICAKFEYGLHGRRILWSAVTGFAVTDETMGRAQLPVRVFRIA